MNAVLMIALSYIAGSVPFGLIAARSKGVDPRKGGSGNIGATNVLRTVGKPQALFTLIGDALKGAICVEVGKLAGMSLLYQGVMGFSALLGHVFSIFLGFRGGKGVATGLGVILIYSPKVGLITIIIWLVVLFTTRYSSLAAVVSFALMPAVLALMDFSLEKTAMTAAISTVVILKHTENIKRLVSRTERRIGERP